MLTVNKIINFYGESVITVDERTISLSSMNAAIDNNGILTISKSTNSKSAYETYSDVINADWEEFESEIKKYMTDDTMIEEETSDEIDDSNETDDSDEATSDDETVDESTEEFTEGPTDTDSADDAVTE